MERCIILDRKAADKSLAIAAGKSLAAGPVETQVVEKAAQEAAAGRWRSRGVGRVRVRVGVCALDATSAFGAGGCVPKGTPGSSSGGTFTLGSASSGPSRHGRSARRSPRSGSCGLLARAGLFRWRGKFRAIARGARRSGTRLPGCGVAGGSRSSSNGSPGGVGNGALAPARSCSGSRRVVRLERRTALRPEVPAASAWSRQVALPSPLRPRRAAAVPLGSHRQPNGISLNDSSLFGRLRAGASPASRKRPPARGVITEILMLVSLVDRIFLVARHPLPLDRRQVGKARSVALALAPASSRPWSTLPEPVLGLDSSSLFAFLASSGRGGLVRLRIPVGGDNPVSSSDPDWFDRVTPYPYFSETGQNGQTSGFT